MKVLAQAIDGSFGCFFNVESIWLIAQTIFSGDWGGTVIFVGL